ncbi:hypothetical protein ACRAWD_21970 [Caulobacter segnis]
MTLDEIDHLLDFMAKEAAEKGDESLLPGVISLSADAYGRVPPNSGMACTKILEGIPLSRRAGARRARRERTRSWNRADAGDSGAPYFDLEPKP